MSGSGNIERPMEQYQPLPDKFILSHYDDINSTGKTNIKLNNDAAEKNTMDNTIQLNVYENESKRHTGALDIVSSDKIIGPTDYDVFINNGRRNHLQYLSLQDTPYLNTVPFDFNENDGKGGIKTVYREKFANNMPLFRPNKDNTSELYRKKLGICQYAMDASYNTSFYETSGKKMVSKQEVYVKQKTYTDDGILYYQKPFLYFRKLVKEGSSNREIINDGVIQTDTYINDVNQTLYSMLSEQPKTLMFYNVIDLIKDISNARLRPYLEKLGNEFVENDTNKYTNINKFNFNNIWDTNLSDILIQYSINYEKDNKDNLENIIQNSILKIGRDGRPNKLEIDDWSSENQNKFNQIFNDIKENKLLSNISISEIILYWTFNKIYPRNKEILLDSEGNITKILQPFDYRNKISYLKGIRTSNLLPRVEKINIYIRKNKNNENTKTLTDICNNIIKYHWIQIASVPQTTRESYLTAYKISKNKILNISNIKKIIKKEKELFDKLIGNNSDIQKSNRDILGNFLLNNTNSYYYLNTDNTASSFYFDRDGNNNYIDSKFNFMPYYFKDTELFPNEIIESWNEISGNTFTDIFNTKFGEDRFYNVINDIIGSSFDIKVVLINNAVVDKMEEIMGEGHRLELINEDFNTLIYYNLKFDTGFEPTLPIISINLSNNNNHIFLNLDVSVNFIEDETSYDISLNKTTKYSEDSSKRIEYIEYFFIEEENYKYIKEEDDDDFLEISSNLINETDIKLYDITGESIDISNVNYGNDIISNNNNSKIIYSEDTEWNNNENKLRIKNENNIWELQGFNNQEQGYELNKYKTFYKKKDEHLPATLYRISFNKYMHSLGFLHIIGNDYEINIYKQEDENFEWGNDNLLISNVKKNPDNFYQIPENIYEIPDNESFKNDLNKYIANDFNEIKPYDNSFTNHFLDKIANKIENKKLFLSNFTFIKNNVNYELNHDTDFKEIEGNIDANYLFENMKFNDELLIDSFDYQDLQDEIKKYIFCNIFLNTYIGEVSYLKDFTIIYNNYLNIFISENINSEIYDDLITFANEVYKSAITKKYKYYIFEIIRYRSKKIKKIKYFPPDSHVDNFKNINFQNKIYIDIMDPNEENLYDNLDDYDTLLNSGIYYKDLYSRCTNNNKDNDGNNIVPSQFPNKRNQNYLKIWTRKENSIKKSKIFNSFNSIFKTLENTEYNSNNTIINSYFEIKTLNNKETFIQINNNDSSPSIKPIRNIIYLNSHDNIDNEHKILKLNNNSNKKYTIIEISEIHDGIIDISDNNNVGIDLSGDNLLSIGIKYNITTDKISYRKFHGFNPSLSNTTTGNINNIYNEILDIGNIKQTNDKMRKFLTVEINDISSSYFTSNKNEQTLSLIIDNSLNIVNETSHINFYVDNISKNATITNFKSVNDTDYTIKLLTTNIKNYNFFGNTFIKSFDISNIKIEIEISDLIGNAALLYSNINYYLEIDFINTFYLYDTTSGDKIIDPSKYKFKYNKNSITNITDNIIKFDFYKYIKFNNPSSNHSLTYDQNDFNYLIRFKTSMKKNTNNFYSLPSPTYYTINNNNFNNTLQQSIITNENLDLNLKLVINEQVNKYGTYIYDEKNERFSSLFNNNPSYKFFDLSGIELDDSGNHFIYSNATPGDSSNKFFDHTTGAGPISYTNPSIIDFDNFKNKYNKGELEFIEINNSFNKKIYNTSVEGNDVDISQSHLCEILDGKFINQDISFNKNSIFKKYYENNGILESNDSSIYEDLNLYYEAKLNSEWPAGTIKERNLKWVLLNNDLYYDLLFDEEELFRKDTNIFENINTKLKVAMENNGGLIIDKNGNPTGFYLAQLFRREPLHRYVIIIDTKNSNSENNNNNGKVHAIINIGNGSHWGSQLNADTFYNNFSTTREGKIINASNQSINGFINQNLYKQIPGVDFDNSNLANENTHYIFNKCWPNSHYYFIKQTREAGLDFERKNVEISRFRHYYLFGF